MKKLKIYLDTSVINFLFAEDVPELKMITEEFFVNVRNRKHEAFISDIVIKEIEKTKDRERKRKLLSIIEENMIEVLPPDKDNEVRVLAETYLSRGVVPETKIEDALHIAYAVVFEMDILLSWNFKHLANIRCERKALSVNMELGYNYLLRIITPMEVSYENTEDI